MSDEVQRSDEGLSLGSVLRRMGLFLALAAIGLAVSHFTPHGGRLTVDSLAEWGERLGVWGPVILLAAGLLTPLAFCPRWPIAFLAGLLYGLVWGTLLATTASTLGAWLQFHLAKSLLAPAAQRMLRRTRLNTDAIPKDRALLALLLLRAFPLSNYVATNLLAGAMRMDLRPYLVASFLGMIPSSLLYAAWGKLMKKPSSEFYVLAGICLLLVVVGGLWGGRVLARWRRGAAGPAGGTAD